MTPRQRQLARHALGLDNPDAKGVSYRNRFVAHADSEDAANWEAMVQAREATVAGKGGLLGPGNTYYKLNHVGARKALYVGERLDPEDFP